MAHEILIVDDEPDIRMLIDGILQDEGYETRGAGDAESAINAFRTRRPSLVVLDVWLGVLCVLVVVVTRVMVGSVDGCVRRVRCWRLRRGRR